MQVSSEGERTGAGLTRPAGKAKGMEEKENTKANEDLAAKEQGRV